MKKIIAALMTLVFAVSAAACSYRPKDATKGNVTLANAEIVVFGNYNGQDIEWLVLDSDRDGYKLLISKDVLDARRYNDIEFDDPDYEDQSWETCTLRSWLNSEFFENAFSDEEQAQIAESKIVNKDNLKYNVYAGKDVYDRVFILSAEEVIKYFATEADLKAKPAPGPNSIPGLYTDAAGYCNWWLRTPGHDVGCAANVRLDGYIYYRGDLNNVWTLGVRPAIRVSASALRSEETAAVTETTAITTTEATTTATTEETYADLDTSLINIRSDDIVYFGNYGSQSVVWQIVDRVDNKALLVATNVVCAYPYNYSEGDVTWEDSSLRSWLNNTFYNDAFFSGEQNLIVTTPVENNTNRNYGTYAGPDTEDKIFVLSLDEVNKYFPTDSSRKAGPGVSAGNDRNLYVDPNGYCLWWLRTPGASGGFIGYVDHRGVVQEAGILCRYNYIGVRPAMWVIVE